MARKKWVTAGLPLLVTGALLLSACGGSDDPDGSGSGSDGDSSKVTLTYVGSAYTPEALQPVFQAFEEAHPNITIKYESVPFDDLNTVLQNRLPEDDGGIDVYDADMPRITAYAARGWLADLTEEFGDLSEDIYSSSLEASTVDGKLLGMPLGSSSNLLFYNKKLLKAADVEFPSAEPTEPLTWQDVAAEGKSAQDAGAQWGLVFDQIDRYYQLQPLPESLGGGPGATGEGNLEPNVNSAEWVEAFEWYGSLYEDGIGPRGIPASATPQEFASGNTAFFAGGPWWAPIFTEGDLDFGVAPFPYMEGGEPATPSGSWSLGVNPKSSNQDAAMTFLEFMGLTDGGLTSYTENMPIPPANLVGASKHFDQPLYQDPRMAGGREIMEYQIAETSVVRLPTVGYLEFEEIMGTAFADIINGSDAQETLDKAQDSLTEAWAKYE